MTDTPPVPPTSGTPSTPPAAGYTPATPGAPWHIDGDRLAAAEQRIREAARQLGQDDTASRVLVAEIGDITRTLVGITD